MLILKRSSLALFGLFVLGLSLMTIATNVGDANFMYRNGAMFIGAVVGILFDPIALPLYIMGIVWIANGSTKLRNWMFGYIGLYLIFYIILVTINH